MSDSVSEKKAERIQKLLIFLCWLVYTSAYLGRYSYNSNISQIEGFYGLDHATAGLPTTFFFFAYGAGQLINGIFCHHYHKRYVLSGALLVSAVINFILFLQVDFRFVPYLWFLNGAAQSVLWSSLLSTIGKKIDKKFIAAAVLLMSTPATVGTLLSYGASALLAIGGHYKFAFLIGSVLTAFVGLNWFIGYGYIERHLPNIQEKASADTPVTGKNNKFSGKIILMLLPLAFFAISNNLVKDGLTTWLPNVLKESYGLPDSLSIFLTLFLPLVGVAASLYSVRLAKRLHQNLVLLNGICFLISSILIGAVILLLGTSGWIPAILCMIVISGAMAIVNNAITSIGPLNMRDKIDSGFSAGCINAFCYVGSTISSYGLGALADFGGWNTVFQFLLVICSLPVLYSVYALVADKVKKKAQ